MRLIAYQLLLLTVISACLNKSEITNKTPLTIYFDVNEDNINQKHFAVLDSVGQYLKEQPDAKLIIGYSIDKQEQDNLIDGEGIGMRRINAVKQYLKDFWDYDPPFLIVEEQIHGRALGENPEKKIEPCGHDCRRVYFELEN